MHAYTDPERVQDWKLLQTSTVQEPLGKSCAICCVWNYTHVLHKSVKYVASDLNSFICKQPRIICFLWRIFRELHVYLSRSPCWATTPLMKIHSLIACQITPSYHGYFAELSRKYPYPQTPAISRGCIRGKANTRGLGIWLSQSLTFGSLAAALELASWNFRKQR